MTARLRFAVIWLVPVFTGLFVYWPGIQTWFRMDDFAWLGLRGEIYSWDDLWRVLFEPRAQGTIRVVSERLFFLTFFEWFGLDALPYRIVAFGTQALNLILVGLLARKTAADPMAAFWAPLFWGVNAALTTPMSWTSGYNQLLCAACLLGATLAFIRWHETGARRWYVAQFAVFLFGFGANELNVIYPGLAAAWALLFAPQRLLATLPMFAVSGLYTLLHNAVAPKQKSGTYGMHFDLGVFRTFGTYWWDAFGGARMRDFWTEAWIGHLALAAPWLLSAALLAFVAWRLRVRDFRALFGLAWFCGSIAPVLPLRDHLSFYYLSVPTIGLSILGARAMTAAWASGRMHAAVATSLALVYLATEAPTARAAVTHFRDQTKQVKQLVLGVRRIRELHPGKTVLLAGVSSELFWWGMNDRPFRLFSANDVFIAPGADEAIERHAELGSVDDQVMPPSQAIRLLDGGEAVVYSAASGPLRNVTRTFHRLAKSRWKAGLSRHVDVAQAAFGSQLGEGWHRIEPGFRWMARRAVVYLGGPEKVGLKLHVNGHVAAPVVEKGPVLLTVRIGSSHFGSLSVSVRDAPFHFEKELPASYVGQERIEVALEVDRTLPSGDERGELGLVLGTVSIR